MPHVVVRLVLVTLLGALVTALAGCSGSTPAPDSSVLQDAPETPTPDSSVLQDAPETDLQQGDAGSCAGHCRNGVGDCGESEVDCGGDCPACDLSSADFYVDPRLGDDAHGGARGAPFRSVQRARDAVRELRKTDTGRQTPVVVLLREGTFWLANTLALEGQDSGTAQSPTIYRAYPGETPRLSGGQKLEGWRVDEQGRWHLTLPEVVADNWVFTQLWVNGQRRWRPRLPKQHYYFIAHEVDPLGNTEGRDNRFGFRGEQIRSDWHNLGDVEALTWHIWTISRLRIASVDTTARAVTFTGPTRCDKSHCQLLPGQRYLLENVREALTEPGEWYLDSTSGELIYLPLPGEDPSVVEVVAPRLEGLLHVGNTATPDAPVEHVEFDSIAFAHTHWATPSQGYSGIQSEAELSAAIELAHARSCSIRRCTIEHTGAWGIQLEIGSRNTRVEGSTLTDLGGGGVYVGHLSHMDDVDLVPRDNLIRDNLIAVGGRMHPAGVGVLVTNASHTTVEHNDITDFYYTGISVGWKWGYVNSNAHHNTVAHNLVHKIGQHVLSDMSGIYTLGISPGTHIHHNVFHDIHRDRYGGWGIYFDQASSHILAEFNLVYDTQDAPFHIHFGEDNTLRNNIWIAEGPPLLRRSRAEQRHAVTAEHNVFVTSGSAVHFKWWSDGLYAFDDNLYWSSGGQELDFGGRTLAQWQSTAQDVHSQVADPVFMNPSERDYRFAPGSPATAMGIAQVDVSSAGRLSTPRSNELAPTPRAFPAATIDIDFETMQPGRPPTGGEANLGDGSGALQVTEQSAARGTTRSLLFKDAADISAAHNPHYVLRTAQSAGLHRIEFALRWETGAQVLIEWRDWRKTPYVVGPSIRVQSDGSVVVNDQTLTSVPAARWVDVEVTVGLGSGADGTFTLALQPEGGSRQEFGALPCAAPGFAYLDWIGFVSMSTSDTSFFIDEIRETTH